MKRERENEVKRKKEIEGKEMELRKWKKDNWIFDTCSLLFHNKFMRGRERRKKKERREKLVIFTHLRTNVFCYWRAGETSWCLILVQES